MTEKHISAEFIYRGIDTILILLTLYMTFLYTDFYYTEGYLIAGLLTILLFGVVARFSEVYSSWTARPFIEEILHITVTWLVTFFLVIFIAFMTKTSAHFSRVTLISWMVVTPAMLIAARFGLRRLFSHLKLLGLNNKKVVVVGMTEIGLRFAKELESQPDYGYQIAGFYHDEKIADPTCVKKINEHYTTLGNYDDLIVSAQLGEWDEIYLALPSDAKQQLSALLEKLSNTATPVRMLPDYFTTNLLKSKYLEIVQTPTLCIYDTPFSAHNEFIKRIEDIVFASLILILISPLLLIIALAVKLTSKGPIIFKQARYGLKGEKIKVWKFRSMTVCENGDHVKQATKNDKRFTPIGAFLRKTSLDELPQFFNVLTGEMSIVGPRPHAIVHNEEYRTIIPGYMLRHFVKPGITGWAQVNGWRGETDTVYKMRKRVEFDLEYMREWSLWLDIKIILFTIVRGFNDKNAF